MEKNSRLVLALLVANSAFLGFFFFRYCIGTAPWVGHDYRFFIPTLIDNYLFQKVNGLAVHWYTPSFAGGLPVYPNPQDIQFSLPQLLTWFVNPWQAIRLSMAFYVVVGFIAIFYFLQRTLGLSALASLLGAVFFSASGFYVEQMAVGVVTFQTFPLIVLILLILFSRKIPAWVGGLLLSLLSALLIYSGSFFIIMIFIFSILLSLPIIYLIAPALFNWRKLLFTVSWGLGLSLLTCGSKFYAIYSLMQFAPRLADDHYTVNALTGLAGMIYQLLGSMTIIPLLAWKEGSTVWLAAPKFAAALARITGASYGMWEMDISLSPALILLLVGGLFTRLFRKRIKKAPFDKKRLIAEACLVFLVWFVVEFSLAKGLMYPALHDLPVLRSLRVNVRFPSAFIFPLAMTGAAIFHQWTKNWKSQIGVLVGFLLLNGLTLISLNVYNQIPAVELQKRLFNISEVEPVFPKIRKAGVTFPVSTVIPNANGWKVFERNATNLIDPFDPLFKGRSKQFAQAVHAGPVSDIRNGCYNLINPTGYVYPAANGTQPYSLIQVSDQANFQNFINRRQVNWKLPAAQSLFNWITAITLIIEIPVLPVAFMIARRRFRTGLVRPENPEKPVSSSARTHEKPRVPGGSA
jgi:hypothetical protein